MLKYYVKIMFLNKCINQMISNASIEIKNVQVTNLIYTNAKIVNAATRLDIIKFMNTIAIAYLKKLK
ncbi:MAG: hypothetical protein K0R54_924 [Clostridiaceae bacterium]|jgi:hypothetical protein|nr:hypothetical protein [Clostridiaceae bacterium]